MKKTKELNLRPMSEHPEADVTVRFYYRNDNGDLSSYTALWTGSEWKCRKPYTIDELEDMPNFEIVGWREPIKRSELNELQKQGKK